ncbi:MAG: oxidoreductase [Flavobacteriaceae bacterium]
MKINYLLPFLIIVFAFASCKKESKNTYKPRVIKNISLQKFDHTKFGLKNLSSIRSIELVDSTAFFIGNKGKIYGFYPNGNFLITPNNFFGGKEPNFRSSSHVNYNLFAMGIESPALLYKITMDKEAGLKEPVLVYSENHEKAFYNAMAFFDDKNGIALGDPTDDCMSIITTKNGGETWQKTACKVLPKLLEGEAAFAASNTNIVIKNDNAWIVTGGKQTRVLHTSNKGKIWDIYNTPLVSGKESTGGYTMAFSDELNGIICGGDYTDKKGNIANKAITKDGGKTWTLVANGKQPGYISCVQYVPNTNGKELFAVSTEGVYFSNDSGLSWLKVNDEGYYTMRFVDKNNAWLAGNGKIAKMRLY